MNSSVLLQQPPHDDDDDVFIDDGDEEDELVAPVVIPSSSGGGGIELGSSRAISPEMKEAVREAISELSSEKFACGELDEWSGDVGTLRVEELVDL